jgi:DNA processing protein
MNKLNTWLPFHFARVSAKQLKEIEQLFGSLEQALLRPLQEWKNSKILTEKKLAYLFDKENENKIQQAIEWQKQAQQRIICLDDECFPDLLKKISDPPILLYVLGSVALLSDPQIGIVGSRNASRYGVTVAQDFAEHLVNVGLTVTSGLASGIDKAAHEGALKAEQKQKSPGGGATIAVVGTGLDRVYPATNKNLAHEIAKNGAIVSEYPLGTKPLARHFPERNRIISGMSTGVLVVEAALKSGSLITARLAMEQGREVFAVPNSINSAQAKGCHQLIRQGAKLVESGTDILEDLNAMLQLSFFNNEKLATEIEKTETETKITTKTSGLLRWIEYEPISLDELVVLSKMAVSDIQSQLIMLEMEEKIEAMSAGRWRRLK